MGSGKLGVRAIVVLECDLCFPTPYGLSEFTGDGHTLNDGSVRPLALATTEGQDRPDLRECNHVTHDADREEEFGANPTSKDCRRTERNEPLPRYVAVHPQKPDLNGYCPGAYNDFMPRPRLVQLTENRFRYRCDACGKEWPMMNKKESLVVHQNLAQSLEAFACGVLALDLFVPRVVQVSNSRV